jgi:D-alanyl-D-alanine carboxypeptidase
MTTRTPVHLRGALLASVVLTGCVAAARTPADADVATRTATADADSALRARLQLALDSFRVASGFPGATLGVALADGRTLALATGMSDTARRVAMRPGDRLLSGSVGKTYVAAVALQLVEEGKLDLESPISRYLGEEPWFGRLPNARDITVRQLMNHTSGLVRYEFQPAVADVLRRDPHGTWTPERRLSYILDTQAPFAAGQGWEYSDTNYIVLGMIIERLTGRPYYDELRRRILQPLGLRNTIPSDRRDLPGVVNGYAGPRNELGGYDASLADGLLAINPQFEWTGGGIASTADDLARWAKLLYESRAFSATMLARMVDGVPSKLGGNARYGLGAIVRDAPELGPVWGHSGFFPGYATDMAYLPNLRVSAAIQVNATAPYPRGLGQFLLRVARIASGRE